MRPPRALLICLPLLLTMLLGCLPQKEVDIEIPPYDRQLVVECYMQVGKPFRLLLTESIGFFEPSDTPIVTGAQVVISHGNVRDTLKQGFFIEPLGFKFYNFSSTALVPQDYNTIYQIEVTHPDGRKVTGSAQVQPKTEMGSMSLSYNADSLASLTMRWQDIPNQADYYLLVLDKGSVYYADQSRDSPLQFDFTLDDRIGDGQQFTVGTLFEYDHGDTLISTLYHIDEGFWRYLNSLDDAASSNGNPFAQPGVLYSTVVGGIGVFTGFDLDRDTIIVP
jgi:Domain of unknown function (DUF4249)